MRDDNLILDGLSSPLTAIAYSVSRELARRYPERFLLEGDEATFDLDSYAHAKLCIVQPRPASHLQIETTWERNRMACDTAHGWYAVEWQGHSFDVLLMGWQEGHCRKSYYWILADTDELAHEFFTAVCAWCSEVRGEVLVYAGGRWQKDRELYRSIHGTTFENLILAGSLKQEIRTDVESFFASRATYEEYGIPWKRGILFIGPPGNGKTHAVKALLNACHHPCLYVKSFKHQYSTDHDNIRAVFARARLFTPCFLVLEDLDSLVDGGNRSFFLNELDGFAANTGIVTLATTNHPERLDASILDRPSRFDRKYHFDLPALAEREAYLELWNHQFKPDMRVDAAALQDIAGRTEGFSFAYLKELVLSSMMRWVSDGRSRPMGEVMTSQVETLRSQMASAAEEPLPVEDDGPMHAAMMGRMFGRRGRRMVQ